MGVQEFISRVAACVPVTVKTALRGRSSSPSRFAKAIHSVLNLLSDERYPVLPCAGALKGFRMRVDWQIHRSLAYGSWEPEVTDAIRQCVQPGMTVIDIGAHSGYFTLLLSKLVGPEGKVIAFEPLPANFRFLEENVSLNALQNVIARREAVAERSGEMKFEFPHEVASLVAGPVLESESRGTFVVPGVSLDDCFHEIGLAVHFIKMDVEGAEADVLRGARDTLTSFHPCMMIELHNMNTQTGRHPAVILAEEYGYQVEWIEEDRYTAHILARWKG